MKQRLTFRSLRPILLAALFSGACTISTSSTPDGAKANTGADAAAGATSAGGNTDGSGNGGASKADASVNSAATGATTSTGTAGNPGAVSSADAGTSLSKDAATEASDAASGASLVCTNPNTVSLVPATHTLQPGQSFSETRALVVTPTGADVTITGLVLDALSTNDAGSVGARIYDATSKALVASANTPVPAGANQRIEIAVAATLAAGKTYRVAFFVKANASGTLFETTLPYEAGGLKVTGIYESADDVYPENVNIFAPQISIKTCGSAASAAADAGAPNTAAACNQLQQLGGQISKTTNAGPAPTMTGNNITPGTYVLTTINKYNGTQGSNTHRATWVFSATTLEVVTQNSEDNVTTHYSGTYSVSGNEIAITLTCPAGLGSLTGQYTATATQFSFLSEPNSSDQEIHVMTRQ